MRTLFSDYLETAVHSLRMNRGRTLLTTIGVAIGIASVTTILALAAGVTSAIDRQIQQIGGDVAVVRPGFTPSNGLTSPVVAQQFGTSSLTRGDVTAIERLDSSLSVAPIMTIEGTLQTKSESLVATMVATTSKLADTTNLPLDQGQFFDDTSSANLAVVGAQIAVDLFGTDNPIGQQFTTHEQRFTVIGVLEKLSNPVNYNNVDFDHAILIDFDKGELFNQGRSQIQQINIRAESTDTLNKAVAEATALLEKRHGEQDFQILHGTDVTSITSNTFHWVAIVMAAIAAISLLVGGIGIMNIMLVGVAERTREVGIRKSVGASNLTIVAQFLIESLLLSLIGGILGVVMGVVFAFTIALGLYFAPVFTWQIITASLGVSVVVGGIFGLYPAIRAARKDPIESLRQYR